MSSYQCSTDVNLPNNSTLYFGLIDKKISTSDNVLPVQATATPPGELQDNGRGKKGCRCGNATPAPGKLTCGGQRCPCYVGSRSCIDCKCKGCRNPHQINGIKVIRPHLQVKSLANSNNSQNTTTTNQKPQGQSKFYIATAPLVSPKSNSMTTIRRIHLH